MGDGAQRYFSSSVSHKTFHFLYLLRHRNDRMELTTLPSLRLKIKLLLNFFSWHQIIIIKPKDGLLFEIKAFHLIMFHNSIDKKMKRCKVYQQLCVHNWGITSWSMCRFALDLFESFCSRGLSKSGRHVLWKSNFFVNYKLTQQIVKHKSVMCSLFSRNRSDVTLTVMMGRMGAISKVILKQYPTTKRKLQHHLQICCREEKPHTTSACWQRTTQNVSAGINLYFCASVWR